MEILNATHRTDSISNEESKVEMKAKQTIWKTLHARTYYCAFPCLEFCWQVCLSQSRSTEKVWIMLLKASKQRQVRFLKQLVSLIANDLSERGTLMAGRRLILWNWFVRNPLETARGGQMWHWGESKPAIQETRKKSTTNLKNDMATAVRFEWLEISEKLVLSETIVQQRLSKGVN